MKRYLSLAATVLIASIAVSPAATPDKDAMMAKENAAWQAFKDKKADDFKKLVDKDMVGVYADGVSDLSKDIADMQKWEMKSFAISDFKSFSDEKDVIVTSYTINLQGTYGGEDASGTYYAGTVWKLENGEWMAIFHTDVEADAATK